MADTMNYDSFFRLHCRINTAPATKAETSDKILWIVLQSIKRKITSVWQV
jgi:hypothetical protein